jgi:hypothetical protein
MARGIADQRGALFLLIFLVYPDECRTKAFDVDLSLLETKFLTVLPYSSRRRSDGADAVRDGRSTDAEGHRWTATAVLDILERTVPSQDAPSAGKP